MTSTKKSLLTSAVALVLCFAMLVGTTFAWFTDEVTSSGNIIQTGKLDANMYWSENLLPTDSENPVADGWHNAAESKVFDYNNWEPGFSQFRYVLIENAGSLDFKWHLTIDADGKVTELAEVIDVYYITPGDNGVSKADLNENNYVGTLDEVLARKDSNDGVLKSGERVLLAIAFHMQETAGNEYQNKALCEGGFSLNLIAAQASATGEYDSFDDLYDENAEWPYLAIKYNVCKTLSDDQIKKETNDAGEEVSLLNAPLSLGDSTDDIFANIPSGVTLADGADKLTLKVESMEAPTQDLDLRPGEVGRSVELVVEGVSEDNTVPMQITLNNLFSPGLNAGNARIIHVEDGQPVEMTRVDSLADLDAHNEFYYDVATGNVVMSVASFSEYEVIENDYNPWNGRVNTSWYDANKSEFTLTTADQLAGFGAIVDGGYNNKNNETGKDEGWVSLTQDSFEGKTIRLGEDIDLGGTLSFNPIGYSYSYKNGQVFKGTFDGQNHIIFNLYVNGWDLGLSYSMAGGGFFASVEDATIKNVTFNNANIVMECIEQGVVTGLAAGNCTFENINIYGCKVANYQRATGGVVGEVNPYRDNSGKIDNTRVATHTFKNINIDSTTVIGSMWGDFDAPVGGVIGAKWDDDVNTADGKGVTQVVMENVKVACRLDVYNDVTSTYQWYAYRRAGMLIGNTEEVAADGRTAKADFLTCKLDENNNPTVNVYYGNNWRNYHYCEFSDYNPSWPFVRVEAGEHCTAFSNPRWGVPELDGVKVTPENHPITEEKTHANGNACMVLLPFEQLYGGGQGVYGQTTHTNVSTSSYDYSIQYINDNKLIVETFVESNDSAYDIYGKDNENNVVSYGNGASAQTKVEDWLLIQGYKEEEIVFGGWVNAGSTEMPTILGGNTTNVKLYPYFKSPYTARFVDSYGNVIAWCLFHSDKTGHLTEIADATQAALPGIGEDFTFDYWEVHVTDDKGNTTTTKKFLEFDFKNATTDVTIYPVYKYNGDVNLIPVDTNGDGIINYYQVGGYSNPSGQALVEIPGVVMGIPVLEINGGAFSSYAGVHSILIPKEIKDIGDYAFAKSGAKESVTIYYAGSYDDWVKIEPNFDSNWEGGFSSSCKIFFLNGTNTVDVKQGYLQFNKTWKRWDKKEITSATVESYTGYCDCEESTKYDDAHIYVDANKNVMSHNAEGTPVNANGVEIKYDVIKEGFLGIGREYGLTDGTVTNYKRYRPDAKYWEGVTV